MNIQSFYEYVVLRDILAYMLPGGISLMGIAIIVQAFGSNRWDKFLPSLSSFNSLLAPALLIMIAFLIGHILDMAYRLLFQGREWYRRPKTVLKILTGSTIVGSKTAIDPVANGIREAVGQFLNINWKDIPLEKWIASGKAYEANVMAAYWIEQEDSKLFGTEIGRPIVQAHFLHTSGLAFLFLGICTLVAEVVFWVGASPLQTSDPIALVTVVGGSWLLGFMLLRQGAHKRDIIIEHTFRVFYVIWRKRVLEQKAGPIGTTERPPSEEGVLSEE